eukprot:15127085-Heterocapsa_arctica.AAC.1
MASPQQVAAEAIKAKHVPGAVVAPGPGAAIGSSIRGGRPSRDGRTSYRPCAGGMAAAYVVDVRGRRLA